MSGVINVMAGGRTLPTLTASLSPTTSSWSFVDAEFGPDYFIADYIVATPAGGVSPYSYTWEVVSGEAIMGPFGGIVPTSFSGAASVIRCSITDAAGQTAYTENCSIS